MYNVDFSTDMRREHWPLFPALPNPGCEIFGTVHTPYSVFIHSVDRYFVPVFHPFSKVIFRLKLSSGAKLGSIAGPHFP